MNRRKAIRNIFLFSGAGAAAVGGFNFYRFYRTPDLSSLEGHKRLIEELSEIIIPETDTPGAKSAGVAPVIITLVKDCTNRKAQNRFLYGLDDVEDYARSKYGKSFVDCDKAAKIAITGHFEQRDRPWAGIKGKVSRRLIGDSFFITLKKYTLLGYGTSMKGATMGMAYDFIPGQYKGIVPLRPGQKCWAT